jgi:hypothetical protein
MTKGKEVALARPIPALKKKSKNIISKKGN